MKHPYFGTCLIGGRHPEGSYLIRECPVRQRQGRALRRAERDGKPPVAIPIAGSQEGHQSTPDISATSSTVIRSGRAFKPGRPQVPQIEQQRKARERSRAFRHRQSEQAA